MRSVFDRERGGGGREGEGAVINDSIVSSSVEVPEPLGREWRVEIKMKIS
jgi:hypothetical protein